VGGYYLLKVWVILNDIQIPFHDEPVLDLVTSFVKTLKPHGVILNGDIVDAYQLSEFSKDPVEKSDIAQEQRIARRLMESLAGVTKERWWLGGNHEDRLRRYVWNHAPKFGGLEELTFPSLFHLGEHGFKWKEYGGYLHLGKLMVTHGSLVSKHSGQTGRAHMEKYGTSILVGHTHRLGVYYRRDVRGVHAAYENGCLCQLNPEYDQFPNWMQGFSVVHTAEDGNGFFSVQQIPILNRKGFFYGKDYIGKK
jgi:predicted phosphodiesterase